MLLFIKEESNSQFIKVNSLFSEYQILEGSTFIDME